MKCAVLYKEQDLRIEEFEMPKINDNEVLVKNVVSTTCGTDVKTYHRGYPLLKPPHPYGHEFSGVIVEVGNNVKNFKVGDRIAVHNTAPCNNCYYCKRGQHSMCDYLVFNRGTYSEYVKVPAEIVQQNMFKMPDEMSHKTASLLEPFACAVYGVEMCDLEITDRVIIIGAGPIGLMMAKLVQYKGCELLLIDVNEKRLNYAKSVGIKHTELVNDFDEYHLLKKKINGGIGFDCVIEATGNINVWENSVNLVRKGGMVLLFGGTKRETKLTMDANKVHYGQLTIKGVFHTTPLFVEKAFKLLSEGVISADEFVQNEYKLEDLSDAIIEHSNGEVIKNCIIY